MKTKALSRSAAPIALAATLLAAFLVLLSPVSASAHDALVSSSPAADESVDVVPATLTLTFSAKLIGGEGSTEVVVTDPDGNQVTDGAATVDGAIVTQPLKGSGPAGAYHVIWKVVSSDGHPTSGEYFFTVNVGDAATTDEPTAAPSTAAPTAEQTAAPEVTSAPSTDADDSAGASAAIWIVSIIAVLVVAGVVVWIVMSRRRGTTATDSDPSSER